MTKTVTCLFDSEQHATDAVEDLGRVGIAPGDCEIWSTPHNLNSMLEDGGIGYATAHAYVEGVIRGGTVLIGNLRGRRGREGRPHPRPGRHSDPGSDGARRGRSGGR